MTADFFFENGGGLYAELPSSLFISFSDMVLKFKLLSLWLMKDELILVIY